MKTICKSLLCLLMSLSVIVSCTSTLYVYSAELDDDAEASRREDVPGEVAFQHFNDIVAMDAEKSDPQYSDFLSKYAGSSIDESGKLTVYLAGECENYDLLIKELRSVDVTSESICFVTVKYSYDELKSFQNAMWAFTRAAAADKSDELLSEWANKIQSVPVSAKGNNVIIIAKDFSDSDYDYCEKFFGEYPYEIEITDKELTIAEEKGEKGVVLPPVEQIPIKPGQAMGYGASFGYRCKLNGVSGFLTTIHSDTYTPHQPMAVQHINSDGTITEIEVGEIMASVKDGYADFTFVKITNSLYTASLQTVDADFTLSSQYVLSLPEGQTVYMVGRNSADARVGSVIYWDSPVSSAPGANWMLADYDSAGGDSGGCVFTNVGGSNRIVGIHDGSYGDYAYITKHSTMLNYYNLVLY